jgi:hypothetical protein
VSSVVHGNLRISSPDNNRSMGSMPIDVASNK